MPYPLGHGAMFFRETLFGLNCIFCFFHCQEYFQVFCRAIHCCARHARFEKLRALMGYRILCSPCLTPGLFYCATSGSPQCHRLHFACSDVTAFSDHFALARQTIKAKPANSTPRSSFNPSLGRDEIKYATSWGLQAAAQICSDSIKTALPRCLVLYACRESCARVVRTQGGSALAHA